eukprot:8122983-Alexandrium_andersonii.AAC.1
MPGGVRVKHAQPLSSQRLQLPTGDRSHLASVGRLRDDLPTSHSGFSGRIAWHRQVFFADSIRRAPVGLTHLLPTLMWAPIPRACHT